MTIKQLLQRRRLERFQKRMIRDPNLNPTRLEVEVYSKGILTRREDLMPVRGYRHELEIRDSPDTYVRITGR